MTANELITKEDLKVFKNELLTEFRAILQGKQAQPAPQWVRSKQAREALGNVAPGTLQNLRVSGKLASTKVGGILYYKQEDIQKLLEGKEQPWKG